MVFAVQGSKDRSEIEMTLELRTLWFEDLKKQDPQTSKYFDGTARATSQGRKKEFSSWKQNLESGDKSFLQTNGVF
jgi:hypothetical protein